MNRIFQAGGNTCVFVVVHGAPGELEGLEALPALAGHIECHPQIWTSDGDAVEDVRLLQLANL